MTTACRHCERKLELPMHEAREHCGHPVCQAYTYGEEEGLQAARLWVETLVLNFWIAVCEGRARADEANAGRARAFAAGDAEGPCAEAAEVLADELLWRAARYRAWAVKAQKAFP